MWASQEHPQVRKNAERVMARRSRVPEVGDCEPLGGARVVVRGSKGATAFSILDAPAPSGLDNVAEARCLRQQPAAMPIGSCHCRLRPNRRPAWVPRHSVAEEIYVAPTGRGRIIVDEQSVALAPLVALRIAPAPVRELGAGQGGLEVLAFGCHSPGDGGMDGWP